MQEEENNLDIHIQNMRKSMQMLLEDPVHKVHNLHPTSLVLSFCGLPLIPPTIIP